MMAENRCFCKFFGEADESEGRFWRTSPISLVYTVMALKVVDANSIKDALKAILAPGQTRGWYEAKKQGRK